MTEYQNSHLNKVSTHFFDHRNSHPNPILNHTTDKSSHDENLFSQNPNTEPDMPIIHPNVNPSFRELEKNVPTDFVAFSESPSQASGFGHSLFNLRGLDDVVSDMEDLKIVLSNMDDPQELLKSFDNYLIRSKEIDMNALRRSTFLKLKRYKNSVCLGEFIHGKRHGKGIMIYGPGRVYEGEWENDVKHGRGFEVLPDGSKFEGGYINGKPEGFGTFYWSNGEVYEGEWKNGLKHGSGMWRGIKGESYYGEWKNGKADGYGVHIWTTGEKYEGEFKGFLKHGNGTERFANGDTFTGNYQNGKPEGYGEYFWANGANYKGNFQNGLRQGYGVWKKGTGSNCNTYEGEWANDRKWGQGTFRWTSGNYYKGAYVDDLRHGYGEMCWVDGSKYSGSWEKGIQHGPGRLEIPGKAVKKGFFRNNLLIESGTNTMEKDVSDRVDRLDRSGWGERILTNRSRNDMSELSDQPKMAQKPKTKVRSVSSQRPGIRSGDVMLPTLNELSKLKNSKKSKSPYKTSFVNMSMSSESTYNKEKFNGALTKLEITQWTKYKQLITELPNTLKDFQNPGVRSEIRKLISPKKLLEKEKLFLEKNKDKNSTGTGKSHKRASRPPWRDR